MEEIVAVDRNYKGEIISFQTSTGRVISYQKQWTKLSKVALPEWKSWKLMMMTNHLSLILIIRMTNLLSITHRYSKQKLYNLFFLTKIL